MSARSSAKPSPATTPSPPPTYLLTVRSALIWSAALFCGLAAGGMAAWSMNGAHIVVQCLVGFGALVGGTLAAAGTLNQLIAPGDP